MKRIVLIGLVVAAVLIPVAPSHAGSRHGPEVDFFIGVGPSYRYAPPPPYYVYPAPPVVYSAPVVVPAPVYVAPPPPALWYYCPPAGAYYPQVPACPQPWVTVPAR